MASNRVLAGLTVLAIAAGGTAWSGCGDDEEDQARQLIEEAEKTLDEGLDQAQQQGEEAEKQLDKALDGGSGY